MLKLRGCAAVVLALAAIAGAADGAVPASVSHAVRTWAASALKAQGSGLSSARKAKSLVDSSVSGCQAAPSERGPLAAVVAGYGADVKLAVADTGRGQPGLYSLAPKLGSRSGKRRQAFIALLDAARGLIRQQRSQANAVAAVAGELSGGHCSQAASAVDAADAALRLEAGSLKTTIGQLRSQFG